MTTLVNNTELCTIDIAEDILKVFINNSLHNKYKEHLLNRIIYKLRYCYKNVEIHIKRNIT